MRLILLTLLAVINLVLSATDFPEEIKVPDWTSSNLTVENMQILQERNKTEQTLINNVAVRGDTIRDYQIGLRQMNLLMRENYKTMIDRVGHNVYPLIVATDVDHDKRLSGTGSEYILFLRNGTIRHMKPTPSQYEQNKNLAHLALSIFSIISPYFNNPKSPMWHGKLEELRVIVSNNLELLSSLPTEGQPWTASVLCDNNLTFEDHKTMLSMVLNYIGYCFATKSVDINSYKNFTEAYLPFVGKALDCASQIQAKAALHELKKWKSSLGEAAWRELYVLIPVIWPVARLNPRQLIFEQLMDKDRIATHILKTEGAMSVEEARNTAGRIIADRTMAHFVFGYRKPEHVDSNLALSTRRDLVATKTQSFLNVTNEQNRKATPYAGSMSSQPDLEIDPNDLHFQNDYN